MSEFKMTKEFFLEASKCKGVDELLALCKEKGVDMTREAAEQFITQVSESQLSIDNIEEISGGQLCAGAVSIPCVAVGV